LYCGFNRKANEGPTAYPVACSPQAWSVSVIFILMQSFLRIHINAINKTIVFDKPEMPEYIDKISVSNLKIEGQELIFHTHRHANDVSFNVDAKPKGWELMIKK